MLTRIFIICLLALEAFTANAQTLTLNCTFEFTGSGIIGTQAFTNASIVVTTAGNLANKQTTLKESQLVNESASVAISGIGTFQFVIPIVVEAIDQTPNIAGAVPTQEFRFGIAGQKLAGGTVVTSSLWNMLGSIGPIAMQNGYTTGWRSSPIVTNGGTLNIYDSQTAVTFEAKLGGPPPAITPYRLGVFSHLAAGGGWTSVITLANDTQSVISITVLFHNDDGSPLALPVTTSQGISQTTPTASVNASLNSHSTLLISAGEQLPSLNTGWAEIISTGTLGGNMIFRFNPQSGPPSEAVVQLQKDQYASTVTLPYDNTGGFVMGVALTNLSTISRGVIATVWDENGTQIGVQAIGVTPNGHRAFALPDQFPMTAGKRGIVKLQGSAGAGIYVLGLRFSPFGTFTSVPPLDGR